MSSAPPASALWLARHEARLAWRDMVAMVGGTSRAKRAGLGLAIVFGAVLFHALAFVLVAPFAETANADDPASLVLVTGFGLLLASVMLAQALESVTRAYYARSDLDLLLSSPASAPRIFAVRTLAIAGSTALVACLIASPVVNALAVAGGPAWLSGYLVLAVIGALATGIGIAMTALLFRTVGPKRTRLVSQILAAIVGAAFVIGVQAAAILWAGDYSRFALFQSELVLAHAPSAGSAIFVPARAAMGDGTSLGVVALAGIAGLGLALVLSASGYAGHVQSAAGIGRGRARRRNRRRLVSGGPVGALLLKEWRLLARDPWLLSQTLMQLFYLVPPALMLWISYGDTAGAAIVVVPVLVMAAGQLSGGLAWLAISGEDAHDLVATAPVSARTVLWAKIGAVSAVIAGILAPLLVLMVLSDPRMALVTLIGAAIASASATTIQLLFRIQARRSMFRRRQVASRASTILEALASILWAATAGVAMALPVLAIVPATLALLVLGIAAGMAPKRR